MPAAPVVMDCRMGVLARLDGGADAVVSTGTVVQRAREIDELALAGIATSGVVLSTLREAADRDYGPTVLADACLDGDRQAAVLTVDDRVAGLG